MCLSNVYKNEMKSDNLMYRNVADITINGNYIIVTDLMGVRNEITGTVEKVDLMENYIIIKEA